MKTSIKITLICAIAAILISVFGISAISAHKSSPEYMLELAERYLSELNYEQAIIEFEKYLEIEPKDAETWLKLAEAYEAVGKPEMAKKALEKAVNEIAYDKIKEKLDSLVITTTTTSPAPFETEITTVPITTTTTVYVSDTVTQAEILSAPTGFKYTSDSNSITLRWNAVYGASGYKIFISDESSDEFKEYKTVDDLSMKITDLSPSTEYRIKITTISNQNGYISESEPTEIFYCKTKEEVKLSAPKNVQWESDDCSITLKWEKVPDANMYKIWLLNNTSNKFEIYNVTSGDSCVIDGLEEKTEYKFKITTMTTTNGVKEHNTTGIIICTTKEKKKEALRYVDASAYFKTSDALYGVADGKVVNNATKSVYVSDSLKCTNQDIYFSQGLLYAEQNNILVPWDTPELVHNSGTKYVYKATASGTKMIKKSKYPMYVTQDGYIAYYESRNDNYVVVNIESPTGETISSTTIYDYTDPSSWFYGSVIDRLSVSGSVFSTGYAKGSSFSYFLYTEQVQNATTGYYENKGFRYLFYTNGDVILDEYSIGGSGTNKCPDKLSASGQTYLYGQIEEEFDNTVIAEYYRNDFNPWDFIDYYVDPEYAAYSVVNKTGGKASKLYKTIESVDGKLFLATDFDGKKHYLNSQGKKVAGGYSDAGTFIGNYSYIYKNGSYYIIDRNINIVAEINGTNVYVLGSNRFSCTRNGKVYLFEVNE